MKPALLRAIRGTLLCAAIALVPGCKRAKAPESTVESPAPQTDLAVQQPSTQPAAPAQTKRPDWSSLLKQLGPPSLMTLRESGGRCEWTVLRPPELEERIFLISDGCPSSFA